jgi:hypothetical protein
MLGRLIGRIVREVVLAPIEAFEAAIEDEKCTCRKHAWDPSCALHGRK